jgi:nicotinamidase-related amidase
MDNEEQESRLLQVNQAVQDIMEVLYKDDSNLRDTQVILSGVALCLRRNWADALKAGKKVLVEAAVDKVIKEEKDGTSSKQRETSFRRGS